MPLADTIAASAVTINIRIKRGFSLDIGKYAAGSGNIQSISSVRYLKMTDSLLLDALSAAIRLIPSDESSHTPM